MRFIQHDRFQPFPQEYHNTYDVVHVRFMAVAFKRPDWIVAVQNVVQLISMFSASALPNSRSSIDGVTQSQEDISNGTSLKEVVGRTTLP